MIRSSAGMLHAAHETVFPHKGRKTKRKTHGAAMFRTSGTHLQRCDGLDVLRVALEKTTQRNRHVAEQIVFPKILPRKIYVTTGQRIFSSSAMPCKLSGRLSVTLRCHNNMRALLENRQSKNNIDVQVTSLSARIPLSCHVC